MPGSRPRDFPAGSYGLPGGPDHRVPERGDRLQAPAERDAARVRLVGGFLTRCPSGKGRDEPGGAAAKRPTGRSSNRRCRRRGSLASASGRCSWASGPGIVDEDLDELAALADSAGAETVSRIVQSRREPDPGTFIGRGKMEELHRTVHSLDAESVILDQELTPGQLRSLEERLGVKVIDRTALILDIFALHARSREGKAQVELAQLNYLLPRLRGWGEAMSRLGGGIGTRGPGETKMEVDRQHIRRRIAKLRRDIKTLAKTRDLKRARRQDSGIPQVAIAGYTNAGKSTLMTRLTGADVIVAEKLFATLDPTTRRIELPGRRRAVISDTVGFVGKLPHDLVEAFRSTLEEVAMADLIVHIADATSPALDEQVDAVRRVLGEIGAGQIPEVLALNKIDRVAGLRPGEARRKVPGLGRRVGAHRRGGGRAPRGDLRADPAASGRGHAPRSVRSRGRDRQVVPGGRGALEGDGYRRDRGSCPRGAPAAVRGPRLPARRGLSAYRRGSTLSRYASGRPIRHNPASAQCPVITVSGSWPRSSANRRARSWSRTVRGIWASSIGSGACSPSR